MSAIDWALYTEKAVGRSHPQLADVVNRPLRSVLSQSGYDPDANPFSGLYGPVVNGLAFGMTGLGVAAEDSALSAAIARLPTSGGIVLLPSGDFRFTSTIAQTFAATGKKKITLQGMGMGVTRIISDATTTPAITVGGSSNDLHHSIKDLDVLQSGNVLPASARAGNYGIYKDGLSGNSPGSIFRNVRVRYFGDTGLRLEG